MKPPPARPARERKVKMWLVLALWLVWLLRLLLQLLLL